MSGTIFCIKIESIVRENSMVTSILPKESKHILIIDDEAVSLSYFSQALELAGYRVTVFKNATKFKRSIAKNNIPDVDMFVVDLMLPPGRTYDKATTENGLLTGLYIALDIRKAFSETPILLWSAAPFPDLIQKAKQLSRALTSCAFVQKQNCPPVSLVRLIDRYFSENRFRSRFFSNLWDSLKLEPNISGFGVDIKKLGKLGR